MARNDWYTITEEADNFVCTKIDPEDRTPQTDRGNQNLPNRYTIGKQGGNAAMCDCFTGNKFCRHKKMVVEFQKLNRVNSRWLYSFDKDKWLPPLEQEV